MALPAAAIIQATISTYMTRHEVVESELTREEVEAVEGVAEEMVSEPDDAAREGMLERLGDRRGGRPRREGLSTVRSLATCPTCRPRTVRRRSGCPSSPERCADTKSPPAARDPARGARRRRAADERTVRRAPAAIFGANDGLMSNLSLIMGVAGAGAGNDVVILAGVAGLLAGAFSMAAGEYISMRVQREVFERLIHLEAHEIGWTTPANALSWPSCTGARASAPSSPTAWPRS